MSGGVPVEHAVVAIPARDEEASVGSCLASVLDATERLRTRRPGVRVTVVVALDRCTDRTAPRVAAFPVTAVVVDAGSVGVARAAAVEAGLALGSGAGPNDPATWIACTDADGVVPSSWLTTQVDLADGGVDLVVGTVEPAGPIDPRLLAAWRARHALRDGHAHVHGANLGVRASTYRAVGGFPGLPLHEDAALVEAVRASGAPWVATDRTRVRTSARLAGRVVGGFAGYLDVLAAEALAAEALAPDAPRAAPRVTVEPPRGAAVVSRRA